MTITARDIHEKEFGHGMRGYKENEVDDFLDLCAAEVDRLERENNALRAQLEQTKRVAASVVAKSVPAAPSAPTEVSRASSTEIGDVLLLAQNTADDLIAKAHSQAEKIVSAAEDRASEIVGGAATRKREILETAKVLKRAEVTFRNEYRSLLEQSLEGIREINLDIDLNGDTLEESAPVSAPEPARAPEPEIPDFMPTADATTASAAPTVTEEMTEAVKEEPAIVDPGILEPTSFIEQVEFDDDFAIEEID